MKTSSTNFRLAALALAGLTVVAFSVAVTGSTDEANAGVRPTVPSHGVPSHAAPKQSNAPRLALSDFPTNKRGQTYGSDAGATSQRQMPDLIGVVGDNGVFGYVLRSDLYPTPPSSPEEAGAINDVPPPVLDVFDKEGVTVVDIFSLT